MKITFVEKVRGSEAGSAKWSDNYSHLRFICPCGCNSYIDLPIKPLCPNGWDWDGNINCPTLKPSIMNRPCNWHGFLTNGEWINA